MGDHDNEILTAVDPMGRTNVPVAYRVKLALPEDLSLQSWEHLGQRICNIADSTGWWIGDWLIYGEERFPDRYRNVMAQTNLGYQTLRNYAWVARRFSPDRRRADLSFAHHVEVAAFGPPEQDHWLELAGRFKWSRNALRAQIRASNDEPAAATALEEVRVEIDVESDRVTSWQRAAARDKTDLNTWMMRALDEAARTG